MTAGQWFWTAVIAVLFATIVWLILEEHFRELQAGIDLALVDTDDDPYVCADEFAWVNDDDYERIEVLAANEAARADWSTPEKWAER